MILKFFLLLVAFLLARMMLRAFLPTRTRRNSGAGRQPPRQPRSPRTSDKEPEEPLRDLTRQKITDAEFEELPPEE